MGDIGSMDERGFLRVTGRVKDMIIRGGMNLYPAEIEAVLQDHPAIETAAVIGYPTRNGGSRWPRSCACGLISPGRRPRS
jgi:fatty-acyl-CoA synthase